MEEGLTLEKLRSMSAADFGRLVHSLGRDETYDDLFEILVEAARRMFPISGRANDPAPYLPGHIVQPRTVYEIDPPAGPSGSSGPRSLG